MLLTLIAPLSLSTLAHGTAAVTWPLDEGGNGHQYEGVFVGSAVTWAQARDMAAQRGGYLATLTSEAENAFVFDNVASDLSLWAFDAYGPWLGGLQPDGAPEPDGGWQWVTGEEWSYTNWGIGEPNDITGEQYLHFDNLGELAEPSPRWNDYRDDDVFPVHSFIVEYPIPTCGTVVVFALGGVAGRLRRR